MKSKQLREDASQVYSIPSLETKNKIGFAILEKQWVLNIVAWGNGQINAGNGSDTIQNK